MPLGLLDSFTPQQATSLLSALYRLGRGAQHPSPQSILSPLFSLGNIGAGLGGFGSMGGLISQLGNLPSGWAGPIGGAFSAIPGLIGAIQGNGNTGARIGGAATAIGSGLANTAALSGSLIGGAAGPLLQGLSAYIMKSMEPSPQWMNFNQRVGQGEKVAKDALSIFSNLLPKAKNATELSQLVNNYGATVSPGHELPGIDPETGLLVSLPGVTGREHGGTRVATPWDPGPVINALNDQLRSRYAQLGGYQANAGVGNIYPGLGGHSYEDIMNGHLPDAGGDMGGLWKNSFLQLNPDRYMSMYESDPNFYPYLRTQSPQAGGQVPIIGGEGPDSGTGGGVGNSGEGTGPDAGGVGGVW